MSLIYVKSDSVGRKIVPAPLLTITKNYNKNGDGSKVGTTYDLTIRGTLLPFRGSPSGDYSSLDTSFYTGAGYPPDEIYLGNNEDFDNITKKQSALRWLFNEDGGSLEWQPSGGQPVVKCNPRVKSITFDEATWTTRCDYTIELETNWIYINGTTDVEDSLSLDLISSSTETWGFEETEGKDGKVFTVSHTVNAQGVLGYDTFATKVENKDAWEHARDYVNSRISGSIDSSIMLAALGSTNKTQGHYVKTTNINKNQGSYEITEQWLLSDQTSFTDEQFNVEFDNDTGEFNVTYQGTITGLSANQRSGNVLNMEVAKAAIPSDSAARTITNTRVGSLLAGKSIPEFPQTKTFVLDKQNGTVAFTFKWSTSDQATSTTIEEVQYTFSVDNLSHTVSLTQSIEGAGTTSTQKTANAKAAIYTDTFAYNRAITLLSGQIPAGVVIDSTKISKAVSINSKSGSVRANWSWNNRDLHGTEVSIQIQNPNSVFASIPVPGRANGPIIQDMETMTSRITTVTIRGRNYQSQPTLDTGAYATGLIISDSETWNPQTGNAERTTRFLEET